MPVNTQNAIHIITNERIKDMIQEKPNDIFGVKTIRVYSQIVKVGRNPNKISAKKALIKALNASENIPKKARDPMSAKYIAMTGKDISLCFGDQITSLPEESIVVMGDNTKPAARLKGTQTAKATISKKAK